MVGAVPAARTPPIMPVTTPTGPANSGCGGSSIVSPGAG